MKIKLFYKTILFLKTLFTYKTEKSLLITLIFFSGLLTIYGCGNKLNDDTIKVTLKNLTEQANSVFNLFYNSLKYDTTKESISGKKGDTFYPAVENAEFKNIADIKEKCESIFTVEYLNENLYDLGFNDIPSEEFGDPVYIEKDGILYVNSDLKRSPLEMVFDYNTINIKEQTQNEITINMDVFDYNFYPRVQATVKLEKTDNDWRISFLFD
ncbi:MAG: hypothetical protein K0S55_142 [Clostridia bacterium]|nr:hypothetical protein [Clostridia bacterium]